MVRIEDLFVTHTARSVGYESHTSGETAFVTNGLANSGVRGFVNPLAGDKVFTFVGIVLSAFLEATVHVPPFIARGNGGSGLIVLEPRAPIEVHQLSHIAAYINSTLRWRFSWYRQATVARIRRLNVPAPAESSGEFRVATLLPARIEEAKVDTHLTYSAIPLGSLYELRPGDYHSISDLQPGNMPIISCGDLNNGVAGFVNVPPEHVYANKLTIAFNGSTLTCKHHPYRFAAKDDVAVCFPIQSKRVTTELFIQMMLGREKWRFSYYRKCYGEKLQRLKVLLPVRDGEIDETAIQEVMQATPYWPFLRDRLGASELAPSRISTQG